MSRSNGPLGPARGAQPPQWQQAGDRDPAAGHAYTESYPAAPAGQANRYPPQHGNGFANGQQVAPYPPAPGYPAPAAPQGYYPAAPQPQPTSYQPVFDRYAAPAAEPTQRPYDPRAVQQLQQRPAAPQPQPPAYAPQAQQPSLYDSHMTQPAPAATTARGGRYEQWAEPASEHAQYAAAPQAQIPAPQAPRGYDFSNYAPASALQQPGSQQQDYAPARDARDYGMAPGQMPYQGRQPALQQPIRADEAQWQLSPTYDRRDGGHGEANGYAPQQAGYDQVAYDQPDQSQAVQAVQAATDPAYEADEQGDYEEEEPRKGRRGLVLVSALVGALAFGVGLAYAYKKFLPNKDLAGKEQPAKISAPKGPSKTQPTDAGGKQFANQDSKLQERFDGGAPPAGSTQPSSASAVAGASVVDGDGVKRVQTYAVGRDGSVALPPPPLGTTVVGGQPRPVGPLPGVTTGEVISTQPRVRTVEVAQPRAVVPVPLSVANTPTADPAAVQKKAVAPKKSAATRDDLAAGAPTAGVGATPVAAAAPKAGGSNFVAIVASKSSRADALKVNAELEKLDVLKGKVFDVQEADLSAQGRGTTYRSVVGPPGSRAYAVSVCNSVKSLGYADCWPGPY